MSNTQQSFRDKWTNNERLAWDSTLQAGQETHDWILRRNGFADDAALSAYLSDKQRILDAGCGNGRVTALLRTRCPSDATEIVGIDFASAGVAARNLAEYPSVSIRAADLLADLSDLGRFDFIYSQEVLHHTADPRKAFLNLCGRLTPGGEIAIYVYKQKAPVREFVDDYVRQQIAGLSYEDAIRHSGQIAQLGKTLADLHVQVDIPEVEVLGIEAGRYDVQRFIYHFFMKCFWNDAFSFEGNAAVNYDWYHPQLCSRHTIEEVRGWFADAHCQIVHEHVDFYGITVRGRANGA